MNNLLVVRDRANFHVLSVQHPALGFHVCRRRLFVQKCRAIRTLEEEIGEHEDDFENDPNRSEVLSD